MGGSVNKSAKAPVRPLRQSTQYNCMAASLTMCLEANGVSPDECSTEMVNAVMGARPMKGAAWEDAIAAAQHYGMRIHLICPATVKQLKEFTDAGTPVMIAWNPEGRPWSHASVVFDVDKDLNVKVADPNIPDPDETVRVVPKAEFYGKWYEKWPDYLVRRPAMAVEREITDDGRQMVASRTQHQAATAGRSKWMIPDRWKKRYTKIYGDETGWYYSSPKIGDRADLAVLAIAMLMHGRKTPKSLGTLYRSRHAGQVTKRMLDTWHSLERSYWSDIKQIPLYGGTSYILPQGLPTASPEMLVGVDSPAEMEWLKQHFDVEPKGSSKAIIRPKQKTEAPIFTDMEYGDEHVSALGELLAQQPDNGFIKGMLALVRSGKTLSEKQLSAIRRNFYQAGMRNKADLFRPPQKTAGYKGNPDGQDIYPNEVGHGYGEPLAGGTDIMRKLQNRLLHEQGRPQRPESPRLASRTDPEAIVYLNDHMVAFRKGNGWWLPAHNLGINQPMSGGFTLWYFSVLPAFPQKTAYIPVGVTPETEPEGIVLRPMWVPHSAYANKVFPGDLETARALVKQAKIAKVVPDTVSDELNWIERTFSTNIPNRIESKYTSQSTKMAASRWGLDRTRIPRMFVPLDGRKPVPMPSSGRPQLRMAMRVVDRYLNRLEQRG